MDYHLLLWKETLYSQVKDICKWTIQTVITLSMDKTE